MTMFKVKTPTTPLMIVLIVTIIAVAILTQRSQQAVAQVQGPFQNVHCLIANGVNGCEDCNARAQPKFGCTAPPPAFWSLGDCMEGGAVCTRWGNYNCGVDIICGFSLPTGLNCINTTLCR